MKKIIFFLLALFFAFKTKAQSVNCVFKKPFYTIHFGTGNVRDVNASGSLNYERVRSYCPTDGHYTYTPYTSDCFGGDWFTLTEDHTPADADGNMLLVNSSYNTGSFMKTAVAGFKGGKIYEFGVWMMNVCKITDKCPFPLLPNITVKLQNETGKIVAQFGIGEIARTPSPQWNHHTAVFTVPPSETSLIVSLINNNPGGCGNDFALDDITFRECVIQPPVIVKQPPVIAATPKKTVVAKKPQPTLKPVSKTPTPIPVKERSPNVQIVKPQKDSQSYSTAIVKPKARVFPKPPPVLTTRTNDLFKQIETEAGEIKISLYDNGEIDGDTISVYHNNTLLISHARLSQKPISMSITIDEAQPHHEFIMVAENLGSIPPNTSVMVITAGDKRHEVFISSNEQRNAKVILRLKE